MLRLRTEDRLLDDFPETQPLFDGVPETLVESHDGAVVGADLEVDLRAGQRAKMALGSLHEFPAEAGSPMFGVDDEMIDPATVAVVAAEDRRDDAFVEDADEEEFSLGC